MCRLFKRSNWKIEGVRLSFFQKVFSELPIEYHFLKDGLSEGVYRKIFISDIPGNHYVVLHTHSTNLFQKGKFELGNILIHQDGETFVLNITIHDGYWIAFEIDADISKFKNFEIDATKLLKSQSKYAPNRNIQNLVAGLSSDELELENLGEFEVDGKIYYEIKDLEDGNYIAIDEKGEVFSLLHDPFEIQLLNQSIKNFVEDVNAGRINLKQL
jgi:hypothetical protein